MSGSPLPDAVGRYAEHAEGVVDLHLPRTVRGTRVSGRPLLLIHGGFWRTAYDRTHTRPMARALAEAGWVVATPEYRRVGPGGTGGWPRTAQDVLAAARALPDLLTGLELDAPGPPVVLGHSAGGQLALWLATMDAVPVAAVVALAPVCDLREAIRRGLGDGATRAFLDGHDSDEADPMVLLDRGARVSVDLVHGIEDDTVPVELSRGLVARHPWVRLHEVPGGHFEPIEPGSAAWATVLGLTARRW